MPCFQRHEAPCENESTHQEEQFNTDLGSLSVLCPLPPHALHPEWPWDPEPAVGHCNKPCIKKTRNLQNKRERGQGWASSQYPKHAETSRPSLMRTVSKKADKLTREAAAGPHAKPPRARCPPVPQEGERTPASAPRGAAPDLLCCSVAVFLPLRVGLYFLHFSANGSSLLLALPSMLRLLAPCLLLAPGQGSYTCAAEVSLSMCGSTWGGRAHGSGQVQLAGLIRTLPFPPEPG